MDGLVLFGSTNIFFFFFNHFSDSLFRSLVYKMAEWHFEKVMYNKMTSKEIAKTTKMSFIIMANRERHQIVTLKSM